MSDTGWELHLRHYDRAGTLKNGVIFPLTARYTNSLDADEPLVFTLNSVTYAEYAEIVEYDIVEVMVRNLFLGIQTADGGFVRDFVGIVRGDAQMETTADGITLMTWIAPEQKHILSWRKVLWPAGVADRSTFTAIPAETAVKNLIAYNCTTAATTANGRWRAGDLAAGMGITLDIEADSADGDAVSLSFAGGSLLASLARVCELGGDYYHIEWQGGSYGGAHEWSVVWGRGDDKSSGGDRVLFSTSNGTLRQPRRAHQYATGTTAVSAGQGEGTARAVLLVDGVDYAADNDIELFVDARNAATAAQREGQAESRLNETRQQTAFGFSILQTSDTFYSPIDVTGRRTYRVGDRVLSDYGANDILRIRRAVVTWADGNGDLLQVQLETELWATI
jgi:hypothetical protein